MSAHEFAGGGMSTKTIGMIGIGQLGLSIAANLIQRGFAVVGYRRTNHTEFERLGGTVSACPAEVVRSASMILLCLPDEAAQLHVLDSADGVLATLRPGQIVIELATYEREFKVQQMRRLEGRGGRIIEAEVTGSPSMVAQRKAALYLGGSADLIAECQHVLDAIADTQFHIGELGSAVSMKLVANYLLAIHTLAAAEAMNLGARLGLDPQRLIDAIRPSAGGSAMFSVRAPMMAARNFWPAPGPFKTLDKYIRMALGMTDRLGFAAPLFGTAASYFDRAIELGMQEEDISAVIKLIEADSVDCRAH